MRHRHLGTVLAVTSLVAIVTVVCVPSAVSGAASTRTAKRSSQPAGTVTWAEGPESPPNYIFPLVSSVHSSEANIDDFQFLMYRPLYWFGDNNEATVDYTQSVGSAPSFSSTGKVATIKLNHFTWSDGEKMTSSDVLFWMNLMHAEKTQFYGYVPGYFPTNVVKVTTPNSTTVVFTFNKAYNQRWLVYNELSTVTPLPLAWTKSSTNSAAGSGHCATVPYGTADSACAAVYSFLISGAAKPTTWVGSPIWSIVDGPYVLSNFTNTGQATFVPNKKYTGPDPSRIAKFIEEPFTSDTAEFDTLRSGTSLDVGYVPPEDTPEAPAVYSEGYKSDSGFAYAVSYFVINFNNPTIGPAFRQLYVRQAIQHLVDQTGWVKAYYDGNAAPDYGPVPLKPSSNLLSPQEKKNPYPFSVADAKKLLEEHGWAVHPDGLTTCAHAGTGSHDCGAGIKAGLGLSFNIDYSAGEAPMQSSMTDLQAEARKVGMKINLTTHPYASVVSAAGPCTPTQPTCTWTAEFWGGGWTYAPDYLPTGTELFETNAAANYGRYSSSEADKLISATTQGTTKQFTKAMFGFENYMEKQLPVIYVPSPGGNPLQGFPEVISKRLAGYHVNVYENILPQQWYLTN